MLDFAAKIFFCHSSIKPVAECSGYISLMEDVSIYIWISSLDLCSSVIVTIGILVTCVTNDLLTWTLELGGQPFNAVIIMLYTFQLLVMDIMKLQKMFNISFFKLLTNETHNFISHLSQ